MLRQGGTSLFDLIGQRLDMLDVLPFPYNRPLFILQSYCTIQALTIVLVTDFYYYSPRLLGFARSQTMT